jgi:hypothetical protein
MENFFKKNKRKQNTLEAISRFFPKQYDVATLSVE